MPPAPQHHVVDFLVEECREDRWTRQEVTEAVTILEVSNTRSNISSTGIKISNFICITIIVIVRICTIISISIST